MRGRNAGCAESKPAKNSSQAGSGSAAAAEGREPPMAAASWALPAKPAPTLCYAGAPGALRWGMLGQQLPFVRRSLGM